MVDKEKVKKARDKSQIEPLLYSIKDTATLTGIGQTTIRRLVKERVFEIAKFNTKKLIFKRSIDKFLESIRVKSKQERATEIDEKYCFD
jgi:hypothetical protein